MFFGDRKPTLSSTPGLATLAARALTVLSLMLVTFTHARSRDYPAI